MMVFFFSGVTEMFTYSIFIVFPTLQGDVGFRGLPGLPGPPGEGLQGPLVNLLFDLLLTFL